MVWSTDDFVERRDFPKGLRVLLFNEDCHSAVETRLKLEAMDYIVSSYDNEKDALKVISMKAESFHVAIIEVTSYNSDVIFRFLEMAKDLPTIVISDVHCMTTMMKCIALGATEFLQKPISEDKLRNIWQHVVHKAFNAGGDGLAKSLKPIKETVASMLQLQQENTQLKIEIPSEAKNTEKGEETIATDESFSAPSTPQLKHGGRLLDNGDCEDQPNYSTEKETTENTKDFYGSKSVHNTYTNLTGVVNKQVLLPHNGKEDAKEEEVDSAGDSKTNESCAIKGHLPSSLMHSEGNIESSVNERKKKNSSIFSNSHPHGNKSSRKKMKVDWTPELHKRFVKAVEQLGIDQAIPSKILEFMKEEGLTRHNVASHLQKFRMHRRHILPKDDDRRLQSYRNFMPRVYMNKPPVPIPPFHPNYGLPPSQIYPVWGHPNSLPSGVPMWGHSAFQSWHPPPESWLWNTSPAINADVWGCPIVSPNRQCSSLQTFPMSNVMNAIQDSNMVLKDTYEPNLADELIDEVVKETMSKPWLPLPLGLKPPSTDSVLSELHRQGIRAIPPPPPPCS